MDMNLFYKIKDQIYRIPTISNITLNFAGEPTLHPKHLEMVEAFNTKNALGRQYKTRFFTNGSNPLTKYVDKVDYISVSLDGIGQVHERMRPGSDWENVEKNVLDLINTNRKRTKVGITLIPYGQSPTEIEDFVGYWRDFDVIVGVGEYHDENLQVSRPPTPVRPCGRLRHQINIYWNGDVTTCCADLNGINIIGNINKTHLGDIKRIEKELCKTCNY
jgi:MoaA/NifB/PqqE/SkfB family radical SAM enzyme